MGAIGPNLCQSKLAKKSLKGSRFSEKEGSRQVKECPTSKIPANHTREFLARAVVIPRLKVIFGQRLKAVLLVGSSQLGVRKGSATRKKSDLDLVAVTHEYEWINSMVPCMELAWEVKRITGIPCQIIPRSPGDFLHAQKTFKEPMQILYGKAWVAERIDKKTLDEARAKRPEMAKNEKYRQP